MQGVFCFFFALLMLPLSSGVLMSSAMLQRYCDVSGALMAYPMFHEAQSDHPQPESSTAELLVLSDTKKHFKYFIRDLTVNRVLLSQIRRSCTMHTETGRGRHIAFA